MRRTYPADDGLLPADRLSKACVHVLPSSAAPVTARQQIWVTVGHLVQPHHLEIVAALALLRALALALDLDRAGDRVVHR